MSTFISFVREKQNIPLIFTFVRMASVIVMPFLCVMLLPYNSLALNAFVAVVGLAFAFTDYLDGYWARKYRSQTELGRQLDPVADKFFFLGCWIGLLTIGKVHFLWVTIFLARDIFVMVMRNIALQSGTIIHVSYVAKVKTMVQMLCISWIILNPYVLSSDTSVLWWNALQELLLIIVSSLTLWSAYSYAKSVFSC